MQVTFRHLDQEALHVLIKHYDPFQQTNNTWVQYRIRWGEKIIAEYEDELKRQNIRLV